jgi:hypothetical protein
VADEKQQRYPPVRTGAGRTPPRPRPPSLEDQRIALKRSERAAGEKHAHFADEALTGKDGVQPDHLRAISESLLAIYWELRCQSR